MLDRKRTALLAAIADRKRRMHRSRGLLSVATALLSVLYSGAAADESIVSESLPQADGVLVLDADTLDAAMEKHKLLMLEFYAPWCEHCKQLAPEYIKAAADLKKDGLPLGKIDCDTNEDLCEEDRWDIAGLPTIKLVRGGTVHDYTGARVAEDIAAFMREVASFEAKDNSDDDYEDLEMYEEEHGLIILGAHDLQKMAEEFVLIMILFYSQAEACAECAAVIEECSKAADKLYEYMIPVVKVDCQAHREVCDGAQWAVTSVPTLKAYRDGEIFSFLGRPVTASGIVEFIESLAGIDDSYHDDDDYSEALEGLGNGYDGEDSEEDSDDDKEVDESNVMELHAKNIDTTLAENDVLLIAFMASWCRNCKRLKPRYAKAADYLIGDGIRLAKVDCMADEEFCEDPRWNVESFPTMYMHKRGKFHLYEGEPEHTDIVRFMKAAAQPSPKWLVGLEEVKEFKVGKEVSTIGFFSSPKAFEHETFARFAGGEISGSFGVSFDEKARKENGAEQADKVVVFKTFDERRAEFIVTEATTEAELKGFVETASRRLVLEMGSVEATKFLHNREGITMFLMTEHEGKQPGAKTTALLTAAQLLAKATANPVTYIHAMTNKAGEKVVEMVLGTKNAKGRLPAAALVQPPVDNRQPTKYLYEGQLTLKGLLEFEQRFFDGKLKPHLRSELPLLTDKELPVLVVKASSFSEMVIDNDNDVLLEFYAPWCTFSQQLAPAYEELALQISASGRDKLVVAKIDVTNNDLDHPKAPPVSKFPSIFLFPGNAKNVPIPFSGVKDLPSLLAFVDKHAYHKPPEAANHDPVPASMHLEL